MFARLVLLVSLVASGMAKPYMTSPVASSVCGGGETCTVSWQDDNNAPLLAEFGDASLGLYVGNAEQQTMVQSITDSVNVASTASVDFTVDPNAGADGAIYFIRFDSLNGRNGSAPYQAFSAKFTLNNMSGTFNSTVQAQINAADDASSAVSTATGSTSSSLTRVTSSSSSRATASGTASASSSSSTSNAAGRANVAGGFVSAAGAAAALVALAL